MAAGTGLTHSEFNLSDKPVHFYQIWIYPDESDLKPTYDQRNYKPVEWENKLYPVASGQGISDTVTFHRDATIYRCSLNSGKSVTYKQTSERRIFVYLTSGQIAANDMALKSKDQVRIDIEEPLTLNAQEDSELILIGVPSCKGWGYSADALKGKVK